MVVLALAACGDSSPPTIDAAIDAPIDVYYDPLPARLVIDKDTALFGMQSVGTSSAVIVATITNIGEQRSGLVEILLHGNDPFDFMVSPNACGGLVGGATCTISTRFVPRSEGTKRASVRIYISSPAGEPVGMLGVTLVGTGIAAD